MGGPGKLVVVATGDSVTSAHNQTGFGAMCAATAADARGLTGNDANFSYAGRYARAAGNVVEYYNFARTGYGTAEMRGRVTRADSCGNGWNRPASPVGLADAVVRKAKQAGHLAHYVTTGGINNTNWTSVLEQLTICRAMEAAAPWMNAVFWTGFQWNAPGRQNIVTQGGSCTMSITISWIGTAFIRVGVPAYDGPAQLPTITADVAAIVNTMLAAGTDKIAWMMYYDLTPAQIDIGTFANFYLRSYLTAWLPGWVVSRIPNIPPIFQPLIDAQWVAAVQALTTNLNNAIRAGLPANARVVAVAPPVLFAGDIQSTALGGCPHPGASGHSKLATALAAAYNGMP
ncbi:hypothetical protein Cs7R123_48970 [Catellatospora sp. TT07R-123]|nr:hypothetical protein Cs7R123_48970 [Catellatospora sp. TT07R-123]